MLAKIVRAVSILSDAFAPLHCTQGPLVAAAVLLACAALVYRRLSKQVYLLDFACYRPAEDLRVTWKRFMEGSRDCKVSASTKYNVVCTLADVSQFCVGAGFVCTKHSAATHLHKSKKRRICIRAGLLGQVACSCCAASAVTTTWSSRMLPVQFFTEESLDFQERISQRNGLGNNTFFPPSLHEEPPNCNMTTAREEAELVLFGVVQEVLDKTGQYSILCPFQCAGRPLFAGVCWLNCIILYGLSC
jgi:hypothetical protein